MSDRGEYRTLFVAFADDPDVHALGGDAFKLLILLKLSLPVTGLGVFYPTKLCDQMNCDRVRLEAAFVELETPKPNRELGWIMRDRNIVWVVNALRHEPGMSQRNTTKHVPFIRRLVSTIDNRSQIVAQFRKTYPQWFPRLTKPRDEPIDRVSDTPTDRLSHTPTDRLPDQSDSDSESDGRLDKTKSGTPSEDEYRARGIATRSAASAPPARALDLSALPREAVEFVVRFYPRGTDPKRRREIVDQLIATLGDGARYQKSLVRAQNPARLAAKCRDVLREGVRDPNAAIVVLLAKLADSTDYTDEQRQRDHVERETEQKQTLHDLLAAEQWLADRPDVSTSIDEQLEREGFPAVQVASDDDGDFGADFTAIARRMMRTQLVISRWRGAGEPHAAHAGSGGG